MAEQYVLLVRHGETAGNRERRYVGSTDEDLTAEAVQMLENMRRNRLPEILRKCRDERNVLPEASEAAAGNEEADIGGRREEPVLRLKLYMSPMRRCRETAAILFPSVRGMVVDDLREMNFGQFEYRNYSELNGDPAYQAYIDSGGEAAFPGGESKQEFCERVVRAAEPLIFPNRFENARSMSDSRRLQRETKDKAGGSGTSDRGKDLTVLVAHGGIIMAIMDRFSNPHEDYFSWQMAPGGMLLLKRNERSLEVVER